MNIIEIEIERLIIKWLKSGNENTTYIANAIYELLKSRNMEKELYCSECQSITSHIIADVDTGNEDMPNYVKCYICEKCGQTNNNVFMW